MDVILVGLEPKFLITEDIDETALNVRIIIRPGAPKHGAKTIKVLIHDVRSLQAFTKTNLAPKNPGLKVMLMLIIC